MFKIVHLFISAMVVICFTACNLEKARPNKHQYLIIASDCLYTKDTLLFKSFKKREEIKVRILHISADSILKKIKTEGVNCEIDAVILSSVYDMNNLGKANVLQVIPKENFPVELPNKHISQSRTWAGIGIDPYVLFTKDDTLQKFKTYRNLLKGSKWCSNLSKETNWYPFYSFIVKKIGPKSKFNAKNWITQFENNKQNNLSFSDSIGPCKIYLTAFSRYRADKSNRNSVYKKGKLVFPNQHIGGSYYNMVCFGIVKQAPNFTNGIKFFHYILLKSVNDRLNNALNQFPINSDEASVYAYQQNYRFKKYHTSPVQLVTYYERLKTILGSLD
jgi:ABC-type Fe3+ transport system substrate-binding protein